MPAAADGGRRRFRHWHARTWKRLGPRCRVRGAYGPKRAAPARQVGLRVDLRLARSRMRLNLNVRHQLITNAVCARAAVEARAAWPRDRPSNGESWQQCYAFRMRSSRLALQAYNGRMLPSSCPWSQSPSWRKQSFTPESASKATSAQSAPPTILTSKATTRLKDTSGLRWRRGRTSDLPTTGRELATSSPGQRPARSVIHVENAPEFFCQNTSRTC